MATGSRRCARPLFNVCSSLATWCSVRLPHCHLLSVTIPGRAVLGWAWAWVVTFVCFLTVHHLAELMAIGRQWVCPLMWKTVPIENCLWFPSKHYPTEDEVCWQLTPPTPWNKRTFLPEKRTRDLQGALRRPGLSAYLCHQLSMWHQ